MGKAKVNSGKDLTTGPIGRGDTGICDSAFSGAAVTAAL